MNAQSITAFTDAAADAVGRAIAGMQREARQEKELRDAEYRVRLAELDTQRGTVAELERRLADRIAAVKDGEPGRDGKDGIDGQPGKDGVNGKDGSNGTDGLNGERGEEGLYGRDGKDGLNGEPGERGSDGKDGERGLDGKDAEQIDVTSIVDAKMNDGLLFIRSQIETKQDDCAPEDVASNVALAVRMMAETPNASEPKQQHVINVHSNVTVPESKASNVNLTIPEQAAPIVNVAPPHVVIEAKRSKEVTKVTGYDKNGRITSFEKQDVDAD